MSRPSRPSSTRPRHARPRPARRPAGRRLDERGSTSIELVILLPALFATMFLGVQGALFYHARSVALAAASEGARAAAVERATASDGTAAASSMISDAGGDRVLADASVSTSLGATQVTVIVSGTSVSVVPGWHPQVSVSAAATRELLTAEP